jgi:hypothetical protein
MNLSWLVRTFVNVMWPFVDSVTKSKVKFCTPEELGNMGDVAPHVLLKECGGNVDVSNYRIFREEADSSCLMITIPIGLLYWKSAWKGGRNIWKLGDLLVLHK